ncbi:hypothetical protein N5853_04690 [Bartonella sp. HY329]|uniref:hypothetical protein n=1 Tax=unclassified Bartonella TaxID=2645622 RepID=UPI0021C9D598|nr:MULTISPECIES: hypothetical protein [unclassified Bartonella]UXM95925.1 hypothetical protein N5853_04690 [Bartonella sp. HY329]UXN10250.1 hypothetical protein N5852_04700 [Bartonella sp. HY328]
MVDSRFKSFLAAKRLVGKAALVLGLSFSAQAAMAQKSEHLFEALRLSPQQTEMLGLERKVFDFKSPKLNFETIVPKGAQLTLNNYEDQVVEEGQIGRVLPLGKVSFSQDGVAIEDNIFSYKLRYAPAALRTCQWQMQQNGYFIFHSVAKDKLAEAELFGVQFDGDNKVASKAEFGYCYARGDVLIAHFFSTPLDGEPQQQKSAVDTLRKAVSYFTSNLVMADGKPNAIDDNLMQNLAVDLDGDTLVLTYPKGLDVVVDNSKRKILPYEFHFLQKLQNDEIFSHLFLWINKASEPESEESFRRQADIFAEIYVSSQLNTNKVKANNSEQNTDGASGAAVTPPSSQTDNADNNIKYDFIGRNSIPGFAEAGIMARSYQYKIVEKNNPDHPTLFFVSVIGYKDKTYVLYYHSLRGGVSKASEYFTGLAGDIAYDTIRESIFNYLVGLK